MRFLKVQEAPGNEVMLFAAELLQCYTVCLLPIMSSLASQLQVWTVFLSCCSVVFYETETGLHSSEAGLVDVCFWVVFWGFFWSFSEKH